MTEWYWQGEARPNATFSTTNSTSTGSGSNPGLRSNMLETNRLNHGRATLITITVRTIQLTFNVRSSGSHTVIISSKSIHRHTVSTELTKTAAATTDSKPCNIKCIQHVTINSLTLYNLSNYNAENVGQRGPGDLSRYRGSLRSGRSGGSNPGGAKIFCTRPDRSSVSYPALKRSGRGVNQPPSHLVPGLKKE